MDLHDIKQAAEVLRGEIAHLDEIKAAALISKSEIVRLQTELTKNVEQLEKIQLSCSHPYVTDYREHKVGKCSICLREFLDREEVDAIYSE
jgi:hypothetical protein